MSMNRIDAARADRQQRIFGGDLPKLWCPLLTHFRERNVIDEPRVRAQIRHISPHVLGLLVPGSTGEGWEMTDSIVRQTLELVMDAIQNFPTRMLIGILKTDTADVLKSIEELKPILNHPSVAGITVCPSKSAGQSQSAIKEGLEKILSQGITTALYQLPQVTGNEMSPETVSDLASRYENFVLFKDTSGTDRVALSRVELGSVFLVRGSEQGGYAKWTKEAGGHYDGFLLSTANVFAERFCTLQSLQSEKRWNEANELSESLERLVSDVFRVVADFPVGNAFTNANKVMDHLFAHGPNALEVAPPLLISGTPLPKAFLVEVSRLFEECHIDVGQGYFAR